MIKSLKNDYVTNSKRNVGRKSVITWKWKVATFQHFKAVERLSQEEILPQTPTIFPQIKTFSGYHNHSRLKPWSRSERVTSPGYTRGLTASRVWLRGGALLRRGIYSFLHDGFAMGSDRKACNHHYLFICRVRVHLQAPGEIDPCASSLLGRFQTNASGFRSWIITCALSLSDEEHVVDGLWLLPKHSSSLVWFTCRSDVII